MTWGQANQSVEPTGGRRYAHIVVGRHWRLPPVAHAGRYRRHDMPVNKIVQIKTVQSGSPENPLIAILTNVDINDAGTAEAFLREVTKAFISHRMCSPPETY